MHENTTIRSTSGPIRAFIGRTGLRLFGWRLEGKPLDTPKYVLACAPHSSNKDLFFMLCCTMALRIPATWMMKDSAFWWPVGVLWRKLGGVPINRRAAANVVQQIVDIFDSRDRLSLIIAPEGTRKDVKYWKLGFYWMALEAKVPIAIGHINYKDKIVGVSPPIPMTGDIETDFEALRAVFCEKTNAYPDYDKRQAERHLRRKRLRD
ncbi:MAG: 1-acyl-sn-glycerol-3-phosphate acyltransferase [Candidatus Hydrogenedentes bacterium]|nr:1-acyl-sn-glycerol-3-phosphate acyltransferase [Candidatus Hydrogenedentota bacterium]